MSFPGPQALVLGAFHYLVLGSFDGSLKLLWAEWLKQSSLPSSVPRPEQGLVGGLMCVTGESGVRW